MITLIAEKPSVGMELARITGCRNRHDGYIDGGYLNGEPCRVTWAIGHLVEIRQTPEEETRHWKIDNLPFLPDRFILTPRHNAKKEPDPGIVKQLRVIEQLFASTTTIVNCGDAGREGELIQRYIYQYVGERNPACRKPVLRLWVSSVTDEALREGLSSLRPASEYDNLYYAAKCRSEADWLVGINATEALTLRVTEGDAYNRRVYSLGRVQTPTLALVCRRFIENRDFKPEQYWRIRITTESRGTAFQVISDDKFDSYGEAESLRKRASIGMLKVTSVEKTQKTIPAPLLYDLTALQQDASRLYDMNPDETLNITQKLYESKLVTYPRTGSRFISHDVLKTIRSRIHNLADNSSNPQIHTAALRLSENDARLNTRSVNDTKVTDHHALLIEKTAPGTLSAKEQRIYDLIALRMCEAFSPSCETEVYSCRFECADHGFSASSTRVLVTGWKSVRGEEKKDSKQTDPDTLPEQSLPELQEGMLLPVNKAESVQGQTKPKPLYTMDTLLEAMKTAGKATDDDEIKAALKDIGIGTPATRAAIITGIMDVRKYIKKDGKKIIPTESGMEVYQMVKDLSIASVDLTGRWEIALTMIADGQMQHTDFDSRIRLFTKQITQQILSIPIADSIRQAAQAENITCPCCGAVVKVWDNNARCTNGDCGLYMNRTMFGKKLSENAAKQLLETGQTNFIKGFVSKSGNTFNARLKLEITEKDGRKYANGKPEFADHKPDPIPIDPDSPKRSLRETSSVKRDTTGRRTKTFDPALRRYYDPSSDNHTTRKPTNKPGKP